MGAAEGVGALAGGAGALGAAATGTTTRGFASVGADGAAEVELLGNALPSTAAAIGVAEEEGIEELLEEPFEEAAPEKIDWIEGGMLLRAAERLSRSDFSTFSLSKSS